MTLDSFRATVLLVLVVSVCRTGRSLDLKPQCGYPGKPYEAKLDVEKLTYSHGETVSYACRDFWAPPQSRKCVNGSWVGPMARCADFVKDCLMKDAQLFDVLNPDSPVEKFHHRDMVIVNTSWKHPNAFTSNRFPTARLRIDDDHPYLWLFNFTRPSTKLFVKININFLDFTIQPEEVQRSHRLDISVEISKNRQCVLQHQSRNDWRKNGIRYDTHFICETFNHQASIADAADPPNYMKMRTKSSHNISHELVALFFGRVYGSDDEPLCGEPETLFGQNFRANQAYRDYIIDCQDKPNWLDVTTGPKRRFNYFQRCIGDMIWNGTRPNCRPKSFCPINGSLGKLSQTLHIAQRDNSSEVTWSDPNLVIDSIVNYFRPNDSEEIFTTSGTEITYSCVSDEYLLVGKETRKCGLENKWSSNEPICKAVSKNVLTLVIIAMGVFLCIVLAISGVLFCICSNQMKLKMAQAEAEKAANVANDWGGMVGGDAFYDNIEMTGKNIDDDVYEIYEHLDGNEYTPYLEAQNGSPTYDVLNPNGAMGISLPIAQMSPKAFNQNHSEDDYVRMLRNSQRYEPLFKDRFKESVKNALQEHSYLEIHK